MRKMICSILTVTTVFCAAAGAGGCSNFSYNKQASASEVQKAFEETETLTPVIGAWVTPRKHNCETQEACDEQYRLIADVGINMMYSFDAQNDAGLFDRMLNSCEKYGISVIYQMSRPTPGMKMKTFEKAVEKYNDRPALMGYSMIDEPGSSLFDVLGEEYRAVKEASGKLVMANLLPNYASAEMLGEPDTPEKSAYREYLDDFFTRADSDVVCFDHYPFCENPAADTSRIGLMTANFCDIASAAKKYGKDAWGFVQCGSWAGMRIPTEGELRFLTHYHMMFGLTGYSYFLYCSPIEGEGAEGIYRGLLNWDGTKTDVYPVVQKTCRELLAMKGQYLKYDFDGLFMLNTDEAISSRITDEFSMEGRENEAGIRSLKTKTPFMAGYFTGEDGKGLYLVNADYAGAGKITIRFRSPVAYKVWDRDGLSSMGEATSLTLSFTEGEGKFVEYEVK